MNSSAAKSGLDKHGLEELVSMVLSFSRDQGVDQAEVTATQNIGLSVTARLGEAESLEYANDRGISVTVFKDKKKGSASTSDFSVEALKEASKKACTFAKFTANDEYAGLADAELMAEYPPDLHLAHEWNIDSEGAIDLAIECEDAARSYDQRITNSEGATVSTNTGIHVYGNTHGFLSSYPKTSHSLSCVVVGEERGNMERDYWYTTSRDAGSLESAEVVGRTAAKRTVQKLGGRKIATSNAPVLFSPEVARGFIGHVIRAITGAAQYRRSSFLLDAKDKKIFPDFVCIHERPHILGGMASSPYDAEGVRTAERDLVVNGILKGYVLSSYSGRRLGLPTTGNAGGTHNLIIPGDSEDLQSLSKQMGQGLLVQELIGQGVNTVTGDYSRGVVGYWVENGQIAHPVHEVTIAGNLADLYKRIVSIGSDVDLRGGIQCGSLLVEQMKIAGA